jgi:DNA-binding NtrC family response regulator
MSATILVMDDDVLVLESLEQYLTEAGYAVVTASSAREALEHVRGTACDVAVLDMKIPEMDGFQVAAMLRQLRPTMRVIMFTGYASLETEARAEHEHPLPKQRPADLEEAAAQYGDEGKWELAAIALEQAARIAEFTYEWEKAATLYEQAFQHMRRARGSSAEAQRLQELAECAHHIAADSSTDEGEHHA